MKIVSGTPQISFPTPFDNLPELLDFCCEMYPRQDAYWYRDEAGKTTLRRSYGDLRNDIRAFSLAIRKLAHKTPAPGEAEHIAVIGANSYPWVVAHNAAIFGLGRSIPLDRQLADAEVANLCLRGKAGILVFDYAHREAARLAAENSPALHTLVLTDRPDKLESMKAVEPRLLGYDELLQYGRRSLSENAKHFQPPLIDVNGVAAIYFTSGTTNQSKGVMLSQANIVNNVKQGVTTIPIRSGWRALSVLPLHHSFEGTVGMYCLWCVGVCICINENLRSLSTNLKDWKINMLLTVPLMLQGIYRQIMRGIEKSGKSETIRKAIGLSRLLMKFGIDIRRKLFRRLLAELGGELEMLVSGAAALPPELHRFFNDIGITCLCGYGLTETSPMLSACTPRLNPPGSVGAALNGVSLAIDAPDGGGDCEENAGEILAKGANVMLGYYENEEATREVLREDGWFHTGDVGYLAKNGCLYITGRAKSMIVLSNGKKVFPEELEALFSNVSGISSSLVWGEATARGSVDLAARFQIDRQALPDGLDREDDAQIGQWLNAVVARFNEGMTSYKRLGPFVWDDSAPIMTTTLKIKRREELARIHAALGREGLGIREADGKRLKLV